MTRHAWLTPDTLPSTKRCRRLFIPDDVNIIAAVNGALLSLAEQHNWEIHGTITPEQMASAMLQMFINYVPDVWCMIGAILPCVTAATPAGVLECDGSQHLRVDYPALYAELHAAYIVDADHFITPDLRGRTLLGNGQGAGLTSRAIADQGGAETHTLTSNEMPAHSHSEGSALNTVINGGIEAPASSALPISSVTGNAGGGLAHNNMQPFHTVRYVIVAV